MAGLTAAGRSLGRLQPSTSALFVCDIQKRFRNVITGYPVVVDTARRVIRGASALGLPIIVTEQYPKALGNTVSELMEVLPPELSADQAMPKLGTSYHRRFSKTLFSMMTPEVNQHLANASHIKQILLLGIEAHVCVLQTALDLLSKGYEVHLLVDGVSSQREVDRAIAIQRLTQAGAFIASSEMALFQLAGDAKAENFKAISALAKEQRPASYITQLHSHL